jgi:alpha-galactosidase
MGMNSTDYGGGTPVSDVWRRDAGLAVGHIEMVPKLVSLPVTMADSQAATVAVTYKKDQPLKPKATLTTFRTFVAVHRGDYFGTLQNYSRAMVKQGIKFDPAPESAFGAIWCAWGYGRGFTMNQVFGALPIVKKLGFTWVTLDDGWQTSEGDWFLDPTKYPAGDKDMRQFVDGIHKEGFKAQLWWAPLAIDPGTKVIQEHPDWLLKNADGSDQKITYWNSLYACPADPAVVEYFRNQVIKYIRDWDYDGLKLDGQFMNQVPPCYNPAHKHARPEDSVEELPKFFKMIYDTARSIKKDAVVEFCPCGDAFSYFMLPYTNMTVASDPRGSIQVRTKGKTLKALHGDQIAYFGDHVRLTADGESFAATVGIGGVLGTNFTWPVGSRPAPPPRAPRTAPKKKEGGDSSGGQAVAGRAGNELNPEMEKVFTKWMDIYKSKMLPRAEYMGSLYDIGFDLPETHALRKGQNMYYSFYAADFNGKVQLRGLGNRSYHVMDYVDGKDFGTVRGPVATINAGFKNYLLLEAKPE